MKSIALYALLLIAIIPSSLPAQNTKRIEQAMTLLENYNDKAYHAIQNVIQCFHSNRPCNQEIIKARSVHGLIGAALKTIELGTISIKSKKHVKRPM